MAANTRCCSPVAEYFSDINLSDRAHSDWRAIMLECTREGHWEGVQETRGEHVSVRGFA
jgi:hypothetical protein